MNYQYNPQQVIDPAAIHAQKQSKVFNVCDKIGAAFGSCPFTNAIANMAEVMCFVLAGVGFVLSLLQIILSGSCGIYLPFITLAFAIAALGRRKVLAFSVAISYFALASLGNFVTSIVALAKYAKYGVSAMGIIGFIFGIIDMAFIVLLTVMAWKAFAASLNYKPKPVYIQQPVAPAPVQQAAPVATAAAPAPVQQAAPVAPAAAPAPVQQAAPAAGVCPQCGLKNDTASAFCKGCGTKLN